MHQLSQFQSPAGCERGELSHDVQTISVAVELSSTNAVVVAPKGPTCNIFWYSGRLWSCCLMHFSCAFYWFRLRFPFTFSSIRAAIMFSCDTLIRILSLTLFVCLPSHSSEGLFTNLSIINTLYLSYQL